MKTAILITLLILPLATVSHAEDIGVGVGLGPEYGSIVDLADLPDAMWASLFVLPDGSGPGFDECYVMNGGGAEIDASITVTLIDEMDRLVIGFPGEDIWLEGVSGNLTACVGLNIRADGPSDALGVTTFTIPPTAGGHADEGVYLMFNGARWWGGVIPLRVNSADINADGRVNLTDAGFFTVDLMEGPYNYRSDFNGDGYINLSDAGPLAVSRGAYCQ